jgi:hypothetical protein
MAEDNLSVEPARPKIEIDMRQERLWSMLCHLSALICFLGIPFGNLFGPWIIWLVKKNEMSLVDREGRKALNFQLSMTLYALIAFILCFVLVGFLLVIPLFLVELIITIIAGVKTNQGKDFEYPLSIKFIQIS